MNILKDRLGKSAWWNSPIKNPTQTVIRRFLNSPASSLSSDFTKSVEDWNKNKTNLLSLEKIFTQLMEN